MQFTRRQFVVTAPLAFGVLTASAQPASDIVTLRGRIVCLTEALQAAHQVAADCETRGHVYALQTSASKRHPLLPTDSAAAVWLDERVRKLDLQIVARSFPGTEFIEVIRLQTWRAGKLYDIEYYCAVCNISEHKPGPCVCCQDPVEYREVPAREP